MADDRLDDAIAAVSRAVERIEAVTRGVLDPPLPDLPPVRQPRTPPPPSFTDLPPGGFAARPTTALGIGPYPESEPERSEPEPTFQPEPEPEPEPQSFAVEPPFQPEPAVTHDSGPDTSEIHELVGRIVARTQTLEEHLNAARNLRFEITELVSRLAAAAERDH